MNAGPGIQAAALTNTARHADSGYLYWSCPRHRATAEPDQPIWMSLVDERQEPRKRAERLSGVLPVYAAPDQDVCSVDM
jgi:hypothetical protein